MLSLLKANHKDIKQKNVNMWVTAVKIVKSKNNKITKPYGKFKTESLSSNKIKFLNKT